MRPLHHTLALTIGTAAVVAACLVATSSSALAQGVPSADGAATAPHSVVVPAPETSPAATEPETDAVAVPTPSMAEPALPDRSGDDLPFSNNGANQPVLSPMTEQGQQTLADMPAQPHNKSGGLPQFDTSTFAKQIVWLLVCFGVMYALFSSTILPGISSVLEDRGNRIASDVRAAEQLKGEVHRVMHEYESAIAQARAEGQTTLNTLQDDMKKRAEQDNAAFKAKAERQAADLEGTLAQHKGRIMADLETVSADLTLDIVRRLTGLEADRGAAIREIGRLSTPKREAA